MKTEKTILKMSQSAKARWACPIQRQAQSKKAKLRTGLLSARSKTWSLELPNKTSKLTSDCKNYCKIMNISYSALRNKAQSNDTSPIKKGPSKGWSVLSCTERI